MDETTGRSIHLPPNRQYESELQKDCDHLGRGSDTATAVDEAIYLNVTRRKDAMMYSLSAITLSKGMNFFTTSNGYIGKGLSSIREDDLVVLITGIDLPMIIQKEDATYRLIGPAYVHGIMDGEKWPDGEKDLVDIALI